MNDRKFKKLPKFIKDRVDLQNTYDVLLEYYPQIKNFYVNCIANPKSFPVIDWLDFVNISKDWGIIDASLTSTDVDRIFISTNYEEVDLLVNDDAGLCRYEFCEIIARISKCKFLLSEQIQNNRVKKFPEGYFETNHADCVRRLIRDYLIPNSCERMPWQEFRDE